MMTGLPSSSSSSSHHNRRFAPLRRCPSRDLNFGGATTTTTTMTPPTPRAGVLCRADKRRVARLEKQFAREMSSLLCYDEVLLNAMSPYREYEYEGDMMMAEVTEVVISSDLQFAKVYVYLSGDDAEANMFAFENLQRKAGYIRRELAQKIQMRRAPEVRLIYDKSVEEQEKLDDIFSELRTEREARASKPSLDLNDREFLDNQDFYVEAAEEDLFPEPAPSAEGKSASTQMG